MVFTDKNQKTNKPGFVLLSTNPDKIQFSFVLNEMIGVHERLLRKH